MFKHYLLALFSLVALLMPASVTNGATTIIDPYSYTTPPAVFNAANYGTVAIWLLGSDASTITDAGGGAISQWADKAGGSYVAAQSTSGDRPTTGTRTINGKNCPDFDGTSDNLLFSSGLNSFNNSSTGTVIVVAAADSLGDRALIGGAASSTVYLAMQTRSIGPGVRFRFSNAGHNSDNTLSVGSGVNIWVMKKDAGTNRPYFNGTPMLTATSGALALTDFRLGQFIPFPTQVWDGPICEVILYTDTLNTTNINAVGSAKATEYGGTWNTVP